MSTPRTHAKGVHALGINLIEVTSMPTADKWHALGAVNIRSKGVPEFPSLPNFPTESIPTTKVVLGVYRLTFNNGHIYIGKAKNLRLRFGKYRTPTSGTEQGYVVRYILLDAGGATVEVIPESSETTRHALEKAEQTVAIKAGLPLLNTGGRSRGHYLKFEHHLVHDFIECLEMALKSYGDWDGTPSTFETLIKRLSPDKEGSAEFVAMVMDLRRIAGDVKQQSLQQAVTLEHAIRAKMAFDSYIQIKARAFFVDEIAKGNIKPAEPRAEKPKGGATNAAESEPVRLGH